MKKISNKNMQQQLFQALFGTIAVKIPLNKAGTFAAPIRATAKVVESLLKFANKRSFNLFVFASAVVLNVGVVSEAFSCTVQSNGRLKCKNNSYSGWWTCDTATAKCTNGSQVVTYDSTTGYNTSYVYTETNGSVYAYTYDPNTGKRTSYARTNSDGSYTETYAPNTGNMTRREKTDANGYTLTETYDGIGTSDINVTGRTLTDDKGKPVNSTVTSGRYTYTAVNGNVTGSTSCSSYDSNGSCSEGSVYTYDQRTGKETSYTHCSSYAPDGSCSGTSSGYVNLYDPNTGEFTRRNECSSYDSDGSCQGSLSYSFYSPTGVSLWSCKNNKNTPCVAEYSGGYLAIRNDGEDGYARMKCTDNTFTDCTTTQYSADGKIIAEYDNENQLIAKYDYDNSGNLVGTYDDQCVLQSCSSGYLEKNGSCIPAATGCGAGYKQIENWCNHIQWTPAEAAAVLNDDNNNSVTITFRK